MLDNYELKNLKTKTTQKKNPIRHYRAQDLKISKMHKKKLSRSKYVREFQLNLCENYNFFPAHQGTLVTTVTCRCLA